MEMKFALVAEGSSVDAESNSLSVFNILENIEASGFPFFIQRIVFICLLERDVQHEFGNVNATVTVRIGNNVLVESPFTINFQNKPRNRAVIRFQGLVIPGPGELTFRFAAPDTPPGEYVVTISAAPANVDQPHPG